MKNVPENLMRLMRATAALDGEPMRAFVIRAIEAELRRKGVDVPADGQQATLSNLNSKGQQPPSDRS